MTYQSLKIPQMYDWNDDLWEEFRDSPVMELVGRFSSGGMPSGDAESFVQYGLARDFLQAVEEERPLAVRFKTPDQERRWELGSAMRRLTVQREADARKVLDLENLTSRPFLEGCKKRLVLFRPMPDHKPLVFKSSTAFEDFYEVVCVTDCGRCEMCVARKKAKAASALVAEVKEALAVGAAVSFVTLTYRRETGAPTAIEGAKLFHDAQRKLRRWARDNDRSVRIMGACEPHQDGVIHHHMLLSGVHPAELAVLLHRQGENCHGSEVWLNHSTVNWFWPHGRMEFALLPEGSEDAVKTAYYLSKYAVKGVELTDRQRYAMPEDDLKFWQRGAFNWPRPMAGKGWLERVAKEVPDDLESRGADALGMDFSRNRMEVLKRAMSEQGRIFLPFGIGGDRNCLVRAVRDVHAADEIFGSKLDVFEGHG